jgi:DNA polymerase I-like protein with 3'-5' exonuclease and polymerase domains
METLVEIYKPNIRKLFRADPGYVIFEVDLKQADAQVVAWEAQDVPLMDLFEAQQRGIKIDIHKENAKIAFGTDKILPHMRQVSKSVVHGTNYGASSRTLSKRLGLTVKQVDTFQQRWFSAHPAIKKWHRQVEFELMTKRSVTNVLGFRRFFFGRIEMLLPEALAWKPQSTVALVINRGIDRMERELPAVQTLMQVHDSALGQFPINHDLLGFTNYYPSLIPKCFEIQLPYARPLTIGVDYKSSMVSWGDCH